MPNHPRPSNPIATWTAAASLALVVLLLALPAFVNGQTGTSGADSGDRSLGLTVAEYHLLERVRRSAGLTTDDLALLDTDPADAETALRALAERVRQQAAALDAAEVQVRRARSDERAAIRRMNVGPRNERELAALPRLRAALVTAETGRRELFEQTAQAAVSRLRPDVQALWAELRPATTRNDLQDQRRFDTRESFYAATRPEVASESRAVRERRAAYRSKRPLIQQLELELLPAPEDLGFDGSEFTEAELRAFDEPDARQR